MSIHEWELRRKRMVERVLGTAQVIMIVLVMAMLAY
jgi:hypothetical protein